MMCGSIIGLVKGGYRDFRQMAHIAGGIDSFKPSDALSSTRRC